MTNKLIYKNATTEADEEEGERGGDKGREEIETMFDGAQTMTKYDK